MDATIRSRLTALEQREGVNIVYACESGSRAWGFPSSDSDYDVRFIYVRPTDAYLGISEPRDVIEEPLEAVLDINGWDLKKALQLLRRSNPPLLEWLGSPIVYLERGPTAQRMRSLAAEHFSPRACAFHYLSMARKNFQSYLQDAQVRTKKYFYALRPLLAIQWLASGNGPVPTEFARLLDHGIADAALRNAIDALLAQKRRGGELDVGPPIPLIHRYITQELERLEQDLALPVSRPPTAPFSALLRTTLGEVWGPGFAVDADHSTPGA